MLRCTAAAVTILFGLVAAASGPSLDATSGMTMPQRLDASPVSTPGVATPDAGTPAPATPVGQITGPQSVSVTGAVTIQLTDAGFAPSRVQSTNGHDLTVTLVNTGTRPHGFRIEQFGIDELLQPGETTTVTITSPPLGDYTFTSAAPGDEHMSGQLVFYI